jgi:hypothetical protein
VLSNGQNGLGNRTVLEAFVVEDLNAPVDRPEATPVYVLDISPQEPDSVFFLVLDRERSSDFGAPTFRVPNDRPNALPVATIDRSLIAEVAKHATLAMDKGTGMEGLVECKPKQRLRDIAARAS